MESKLPQITVIVPVYNESENIRTAYHRIRNVFADLSGRYRLELLFSDNHSTDSTFAETAALAVHDPDVKVIRLSRNYGFQRSVLTAYRHASGEAAIQIDCDLQDPPELIPEFLKLWEQGHDVVVGIRRGRRENRALRLARRVFYWLVRQISDEGLLEGAGDFRLVDRSVIERLRSVNDLHPYTRGLISALAARQTGIIYDRDERRFGTSKFPVARLFSIAVDGIVNHSLVPLRLATYIGVAVSVLAILCTLYCIVAYFVHGADWPRGFATLATLLMMSIGINAILIGIVGEYIGRIYDAVRGKPLSIIERTVNIVADTPNASLRANHDETRIGNSEQPMSDNWGHAREDRSC